MPSPQLERYARIARHSGQGVACLPGRVQDTPVSSDTLDDRICALIPDMQSPLHKPEPRRPRNAWWPPAASVLWWGVVLLVFSLAR